jgi:hypothetical protein
MRSETLKRLRARRDDIQRRWEILLRVEPVSGPLANPDALMHLIPETMAQTFASVEAPSDDAPSIAAARAESLPGCHCGNNPYLAYFLAAEQALVEALIHVQAELPAADRTERDISQLIVSIRRQARTEIDAFCGLCLHRCQTGKCRHVLVN